jgi:hypothetical protein
MASTEPRNVQKPSRSKPHHFTQSTLLGESGLGVFRGAGPGALRTTLLHPKYAHEAP